MSLYKAEIIGVGIPLNAGLFGSWCDTQRYDEVFLRTPSEGTLRSMLTIPTLDRVLTLLREREEDLRRRGVVHAAVFGSVARGDEHGTSDIDLMVDLDRANVSTLFEYIGIALDLAAALGRHVDLAVRDNLKRHVRPNAEAEAVYAF